MTGREFAFVFVWTFIVLSVLYFCLGIDIFWWVH